MCAAIELEGLPLGSDYRQEVAYAYDVESGKARRVGYGLNRRYGALSPTEIPCTLDEVGIFDGVIEVHDYKLDGFCPTAPPTAENPQLLFGALGVALTRGVYSVRLSAIHIRQDGTHWRDPAEVDALDLDAFELRLRRIWQRTQEAREVIASGRTPDVSRGPWCRYCPAAQACPAVTSLIRAVAADPVATADQLLSMLTPETASAAYTRLKEIEAVLKPVKSALWAYASEQAIALPDGRRYGSVETEKEVYNAIKTRAVLREVCGAEVAEAACTFKTSKTAVARAANEYAARVKAAAKERGEKVTQKEIVSNVIAQVEKAGAVARQVKRSVRVHRMTASGVEVEDNEKEETE
jgi:hypothetical protein